MSTAGYKALPTNHKSKIAACKPGYGTVHEDQANPTMAEDSTCAANPHVNPNRRPSAKVPATPPSKKVLSASTGSVERRRLETQYTTKKKRYAMLTKELMDKKKTVQELYDDMSQLREKVIASGGKDPGKPEDLKFLDTAHTRQTTIEPNPRESSTEESTEQPEDDLVTKFLDSLQSQLQELPRKIHELCRDTFERDSNFATFVASWLTDSKSEGSEIALETELDAYKIASDDLKARFEVVADGHKEWTEEILRGAQGLREEISRCRARMRELSGLENLRNVREQLVNAQEELRLERERAGQVKERTRQAEAQLQKARTRIRELENQVASDEEKHQKLQASVRTLESLAKQREQAAEQRVRDVQRALKNSEDLVAKMETQRDSFESRLMELKEKMSEKEAAATRTIQEMSEQMESMSKIVREEREKRQQTENACCASEERYRQLQEKSQNLCELSKQTNHLYITDGNHTDNEIRLYNELQAARTELEEQRERMIQLQQEKEEIITLMDRSRDDEDESKHKLAVEFLSKSKELQNLTMEYAELERLAQNVQEKNSILERQITEIQARLRAQSKEDGREALSAQAIELQQQVSDLRNALTEVAQHNKELEMALTQKQLDLEQRDRVLHEQSKFLKARDELLNALKARKEERDEQCADTDDNSETDQVSREIAAKTEAIQELYLTLENKQLQIMRLEKMVKLMEDQQDRAQAQRTRLENRIAQLEHDIQRNKEHRYVGEIAPSMLDPPPAFSRLETSSRARSFHDRRSFDPRFLRRFSRIRGLASARKNPQLSSKSFSGACRSSDEDLVYVCESCRRQERVAGQGARREVREAEDLEDSSEGDSSEGTVQLLGVESRRGSRESRDDRCHSINSCREKRFAPPEERTSTLYRYTV
ncbi:hypothetical protein KM043_013768 [Ampulex compressa]|nr:hypothetical protein KM043_013768 [Ampulex compressa]